MKFEEIQSIYCIGRNYADHIAELKNEFPKEPLVFLKSKGSLCLKNQGIVELNSLSKNIHHEHELVLRVCRDGENIKEEVALSYIDAIALGIDFTARDIQDHLKAKGHPWMKAKSLKNYTLVSDFSKLEKVENFSLFKNEKLVQSGSQDLMIYSFSKIVSYLSTLVPLKKGDILFTGTPAGVGPVQDGDILRGKLNGQTRFEVQIYIPS